jgi:hypothetical protein
MLLSGVHLRAACPWWVPFLYRALWASSLVVAALVVLGEFFSALSALGGSSFGVEYSWWVLFCVEYSWRALFWRRVLLVGPLLRRVLLAGPLLRRVPLVVPPLCVECS